jgi:hypothetical protein
VTSGTITEVKYYATNAFHLKKFSIMPIYHYKEVAFTEVTNFTDFLKAPLNKFFRLTPHIAQVYCNN